MTSHRTTIRSATRPVAVAVCVLVGTVLVSMIATASMAAHSRATATRLVIGVNALPITLDNNFAPGQESAESVINIYDPLWNWKNVRDEQGIPSANIAAGANGMVNWLVRKTDVSKNKRTYTLHLRQGVKSAAGNEMTSADVKWSLDRAFGTKAIGTYIMAVAGVPNPAAVSVVDKYTVRIRLAGPNGIMRQSLFVHPGRILDSTVAKQHATASDPWATTWLKTNSAGFGPYSVTSFTPGQQVIFEANPSYWHGKPQYDQIIYREIPDASQRLSLLQQGQIDIAEGLSIDQLNALKGKSGVKVISTVKNQFLYGALNTTKGPTANPRVRQALQYAVPQQQINQVVYRGTGRPLANLIPQSYPGRAPSVWKYTYNLAKAKALLAAAGYGKGFTLRADVNADIPDHTSAAVILQAAYKKIGVNLVIDKKPTAAYFTGAASGDYGVVIAGSYAVVDEVCYHEATFVTGSGAVAFNNYKNPSFEATLAKCAKTDGPARVVLGKKLQAISAKDVPSLSLVEQPTTYGLRSDVNGYTWSTYNQLRFDDLR